MRPRDQTSTVGPGRARPTACSGGACRRLARGARLGLARQRAQELDHPHAGHAGARRRAGGQLDQDAVRPRIAMKHPALVGCLEEGPRLPEPARDEGRRLRRVPRERAQVRALDVLRHDVRRHPLPREHADLDHGHGVLAGLAQRAGGEQPLRGPLDHASSAPRYVMSCSST